MPCMCSCRSSICVSLRPMPSFPPVPSTPVPGYSTRPPARTTRAFPGQTVPQYNRRPHCVISRYLLFRTPSLACALLYRRLCVPTPICDCRPFSFFTPRLLSSSLRSSFKIAFVYDSPSFPFCSGFCCPPCPPPDTA